jgi:hypothetical protein
MSDEPEIVCDVCGSTRVIEIKCKVQCANCGAILRTCSDLHADLTRLVTRGY